MKRSLLHGIYIGVQDVIFKTDSSTISDALFGTITPPVAIVDIIGGILHKLQDFKSTQLLYMRRQGNKPIHTLAKHAKGMNNFITWIEKSIYFAESFAI